jgi:NAD(P)-dependent dehydrogenase (short-subunit alcohol dehydrogenase family)
VPSAALAQGDRVAATARDLASVQDLADDHGDAVLPVRLDVTDKAQVARAVQQAVERFGRLDVVVNNAGFGVLGAVEELSEQQAREQLETNYFGALWVVQAVLPQLRKQGSGRIVQVSSTFGVAAFPLFGGHHAAKWALEGMSESLAQEVAALGIKVTIAEPQAYSTEWAGSSLAVAETNQAYDQVRENYMAWVKDNIELGEPAAAARGLVEVVNSGNPPLRVFLGTAGHQWLPAIYAGRPQTWADWADLSHRALR